MLKFSVYLLLILGAYLFQTVLYPALLTSALRVDLFLVILLHFSFSHARYRALILALVLGLLKDVGLPLKGCYYPLIYLGIAFLAVMLWQNLNLHTRRYQALFLGLCTLLEGGGIWTFLWLQGAEFAQISYVLKIAAVRTVATVFVGPLLLAGLERIDRSLSVFNKLQEYQEA